jgi:hypothetical protein
VSIKRLGKELASDTYMGAAVDKTREFTARGKIAIVVFPETTTCSLVVHGSANVGKYSRFGFTAPLSAGKASALTAGSTLSLGGERSVAVFESGPDKVFRTIESLTAATNQDGTVTLAVSLNDVPGGKGDVAGPSAVLIEGELPVTCDLVDERGGTREDPMLKTVECNQAIKDFGIGALVSQYLD